jgi:phage terminase large subunit-like protein
VVRIGRVGGWVVAADAAGNLGHNPSGVIFDEVLTQVSQWVDGGWITGTPGDVIDYDVIYADITEDCATLR